MRDSPEAREDREWLFKMSMLGQENADYYEKHCSPAVIAKRMQAAVKNGAKPKGNWFKW